MIHEQEKKPKINATQNRKLDHTNNAHSINVALITKQKLYKFQIWMSNSTDNQNDGSKMRANKRQQCAELLFYFISFNCSTACHQMGTLLIYFHLIRSPLTYFQLEKKN